MNAPVAVSVTIEDYLSNPAYEHCEYVEGAVLEMAVGTGPHSAIQLNCAALLRQYFREKGGGRAFTELRCRLRIGGQVRFYQPDVAVALGSGSYDFKFLDGAPDLAVEIRSPDDRMIELFRKAETYFACGTRAVWLIDLEERSLFVLRPKSQPMTLTSAETLEAGDPLPGFRVAVDEFFA